MLDRVPNITLPPLTVDLIEIISPNLLKEGIQIAIEVTLRDSVRLQRAE